jgi:hypothetical protein
MKSALQPAPQSEPEATTGFESVNNGFAECREVSYQPILQRNTICGNSERIFHLIHLPTLTFVRIALCSRDFKYILVAHRYLIGFSKIPTFQWQEGPCLCLPRWCEAGYRGGEIS